MSDSAELTFGRYRLIEPAGRTPLGELWRAKRHGVEGFQKTVLVLRVGAELSRDPRFAAVFEREARLALRLGHANVVQVFDLGREPSGEYWATLEWAPGFDLAELVTRLGPRVAALPPGFAVYVAAEVSKALDHAHRRRDEQHRVLGIVHGDLGLDTVRCTWDGEVRLGGFCVTRALWALHRGGVERPELAARFSHASPEVAAGNEPTPASDLFALGVQIYALLTGVQPLAGATPGETLRRVRAAEHVPLTTLRPGVPDALGALVARLLAREPAARPESAARVYEDLLAIAYGTGARFGAAELAALLQGLDESPVASARVELASSSFEAAQRLSSPPPPPAVKSLVAPGDQARDASILALAFGEPAPGARERARRLLVRYGARLLGDSPRTLSATFGLGAADGRDVETAVRAGLVLTRSLAPLLGRFGVGVATGPLHLLADGSAADDSARRALLAQAEAWARLAEREVLIASDASRSLRGAFALEPRGELFAVGAPLEPAGGFVGRRNELRTLGELIAQASRGVAGATLLSGEAGVGKTRLVIEMQRRLGRGAFDVACHLATCPPRGEPLSGVTEMWRTLSGISEGDPLERIRAVEPRLRELGLRDREIEATLAALGGARGEATEDVEALGHGLTRTLARLCEERVTVLVWDDCESLDEPSRALLTAVLDRLKHARLVAIFVARDAHFALGRELVPVPLGRLGDDEAVLLAARRLNAREIADDVVRFLQERAMGHPMLLEETLRVASESSSIVVEGGVARGRPLVDPVSVPRTLRAALDARIRAHSESERSLLVAAAIVGAPADVAVLAAMLDTAVGTVSELAWGLERGELLRRAGPVALRFPSPLVPEVVLQGLPPTTLADLHRQAANAYQVVLGERTEEEAGRIAHHLALAGERDRAAGFAATSGLWALGTRRLERAVADLTRAIELADLSLRAPEEVEDWVTALARAARHVRSGALLVPALERVEAWRAASLPATDERGLRITIALGSSYGALGHPRARTVLASAVAAAGERPEILRAALVAEADVAMRQGEPRHALSALAHASALGEDLSPDGHRVLLVEAHALGATGDTALALARLDHAERVAPADDAALACERAKIRALVLAFAEDWAGSERASELAADLAERAGLRYEVAVARHNQGDAWLRLGDRARAYAALQASLAVAHELGAERLRWLDQAQLAYLEVAAGHGDVAVLVEACAHAERSGWTFDAVAARCLYGEILAQRGQRAEARALLEATLEQALGTGHGLLIRDCQRALARL